MDKPKRAPPLELSEAEFQVVIALRAMKPYGKLEIALNQNGSQFTVKKTESVVLQKVEK